MTPAAELRVYQPLEAFAPEEQARWERYLVAGAPRPARPRFRDRATAPGLGFLEPTGEEGASIKVVEGHTFVCPWRTDLRVLAGVLAFREAAPFDGAGAFVPRTEARRASRELRRLRRRNPAQIATVMQSPWHVPIRWFVLFEDEERRLREVGGRYRLSYLSTAKKAIRRVERAIPILRGSELGPIAELLVELHRWLSRFDPRSLLELDYAGLCDLVTWDEMDDDHSAREVHTALDALASGELARSAELYQAALSRSAELRGRESLS
ncbi:MAG TPA: hypothetical protein VE669_11480 [Actinomycetota bacterium]|jgi:hypothetical protein|nr:hypothetical protein [Actinomycetota bacterium]